MLLLGALSAIIWQHTRLRSKQDNILALEEHTLTMNNALAVDSLLLAGEFEKAEAYLVHNTGPGRWLVFEQRRQRLDTLRRHESERRKKLAAFDAAVERQRSTIAHLSEEVQKERQLYVRQLRANQALLDSLFSVEATIDSLRRQHTQNEQQMKATLASLRAELNAVRDTLANRGFIQFKSPSGVDIVYLGDIVDGQAHGQGIGIWADGTKYQGEWRYGVKHGRGLYKYPDGDSYEGEFKDNKRHGQGVYRWANGDYYQGGWAEDRRSGEGVIINNSGRVVRSGIWDRDRLVERKDLNDNNNLNNHNGGKKERRQQ
jgi:hypothetical protein